MKRILMFLVLQTTVGCQREESTAPTGKPASPVAVAQDESPPSTTGFVLVKPERKTLKTTISQPGEVQPFEQTPIHAKIAGFVLKVNKDIGDPVKEGELLAELSVPEMDEELNQKKAMVVQSAAEVEQTRQSFNAATAYLATAESQVKEAEAGRQRALANYDRWQKEYNRVETLVKNKVIDEQTRDETLNQFQAAQAVRAEVEAKVKSAQALRDESKAKRGKADADVKAAGARKQVAEADDRRVAALVQYKYLRAPFKGVVTERHVDKGHLLQMPAGRSEPLFVVMNTDPVRVFVEVPENEARLIGDALPATVRVQALKGLEFSGSVTRSAWALDAKARTLKTAIDLPNPDGKLRPSMYVSTTIFVEHKDVLTLPLSAIVTQGEQTFCYRVEQGKALKMPVHLGLRDTQVIEVMKKKTGSSWEDWTGSEEIVRDGTSVK